MGCRSAPSLCASEMRYFPRGGVSSLQGASAMSLGADAAVGQRNNCRKIVLVSIKVATFTPKFQYLRSVDAPLCTLKFTGLPMEAHTGVHGIRMCGQEVVSKHNCSRGQQQNRTLNCFNL